MKGSESRRLRRLAPAAAEGPLAMSSTRINQPLTKRRRLGVTIACEPCRERKSRVCAYALSSHRTIRLTFQCTGDCPCASCSKRGLNCTYLLPNSSKRTAKLSKEKEDPLIQKLDELRQRNLDNKELIAALRNRGYQEVQSLLHLIRSGKTSGQSCKTSKMVTCFSNSL